MSISSKNKGFTLIELLVVIAIIALLMGILMPALAKVRKQARGAACLSQIKQWSLIWSMYFDDNDGYMPDIEDGIGLITLNRPHRMNAWTGRMHTEYRFSLAELDRDPAVRIIVVTGKGRGFCVGGDAEALQGHAEKGGYDPGTPKTLAEPGYGIDPAFDASFAYQFGLGKPVIAAMNGPAAGVGLALACFADLRFAAAGARFTTIAPSRRSISPPIPGMRTLKPL